MAKKMYEEANIAAIASEIRKLTQSEETYKASEMPYGVQEVSNTAWSMGYDAGYWDGESVARSAYESGYSDGFSDGYWEGYAEGEANGGSSQESYDQGYQEGYDKGFSEGHDQGYNEGSAEVGSAYSAGYSEGYDMGSQEKLYALWETLQLGGERTDYSNGFVGPWWDDNTFQPHYDFIVRGTGYRVFGQSRITKINVAVDVRTASNCTTMFSQCEQLQSIKLVIVDENTVYDNWFNFNYALEDIAFEGVIANNIKFHMSPILSKASIVNVMSHVSPTATLTATFKQEAVNKAFETSSGANDGSTSAEWQSIINAKPANVTVALV